MIHKMKSNEESFERVNTDKLKENLEKFVPYNEQEETGIKNVRPISKDIYSIEIVTVDGHEKREKYVGSHVHLNVTYLLEADENEEIHIKEDENSGVKWFPINEVVKVSSEPWVCDRVYTKIIDKMKRDGIVKNN